MKNWTWQKWLGKLTPVIAALIIEGIWQFLELPAPGWAPIVGGGLTFLVQQIVALFPPKATG